MAPKLCFGLLPDAHEARHWPFCSWAVSGPTSAARAPFSVIYDRNSNSQRVHRSYAFISASILNPVHWLPQIYRYKEFHTWVLVHPPLSRTKSAPRIIQRTACPCRGTSGRFVSKTRPPRLGSSDYSTSSQLGAFWPKDRESPG